jgi:hypothetical protein
MASKGKAPKIKVPGSKRPSANVIDQSMDDSDTNDSIMISIADLKHIINIEINSALKTFVTDIAMRFESLDNEVTEMKKVLTDKLDEISVQQKLTTTKETKAPELQLKNECTDARQYVEAVKSVQKEEMNRDVRKCNIKITGLPTIKKDSSEIANLNEMLAEPFPNHKFSLTQAKRISRQNKPDIVIATFKTVEHRNELLNKSHILKKSNNFTNIYFSPDWTPEQELEQYHLRTEIKLLNNEALISNPNFKDWFVIRNGRTTQLSKTKRSTV